MRPRIEGTVSFSALQPASGLVLASGGAVSSKFLFIGWFRNPLRAVKSEIASGEEWQISL